jgi:hypothetical protein
MVIELAKFPIEFELARAAILYDNFNEFSSLIINSDCQDYQLAFYSMPDVVNVQ